MNVGTPFHWWCQTPSSWENWMSPRVPVRFSDCRAEMMALPSVEPASLMAVSSENIASYPCSGR